MTYLLFAGEEYYPKGGFNDLVGSFVSLPDAIESINEKTKSGCAQGFDRPKWFHVAKVCYDGHKVVACGGVAYQGAEDHVGAELYNMADITCESDDHQVLMWMPCIGAME